MNFIDGLKPTATISDRYAILLVWFGVFVFAHDWVYRMHSRWFKMSVETFDAANYIGVSIYKIGIILFNLVPLIALHFV